MLLTPHAWSLDYGLKQDIIKKFNRFCIGTTSDFNMNYGQACAEPGKTRIVSLEVYGTTVLGLQIVMYEIQIYNVGVSQPAS